MEEGSIVPAALPQADGSTKSRPTLVLRETPAHRDLLLCGISTQVHGCIAGFDELLRPADADFASSGLRAASLVRLGFLAVLPRRRVLGTLGGISEARHRRLLEALAGYVLANGTTAGPPADP